MKKYLLICLVLFGCSSETKPPVPENIDNKNADFYKKNWQKLTNSCRGIDLYADKFSTGKVTDYEIELISPSDGPAWMMPEEHCHFRFDAKGSIFVSKDNCKAICLGKELRDDEILNGAEFEALPAK